VIDTKLTMVALQLPTVHYTPQENMIRIETIPGVVYKYTLDGTLPTYNSPTYTTPILIPRDVTTKMIKVAAFPKLAFPSRIVEIPIGPAKSPVKPSTVKMNKSAIQRFKTPPISPKKKPIPPSAMTVKEMENAITKKSLDTKRIPSPQKKACAVTCKAEGTNVEFQFEKMVIVSKVIIKTPGENKGPASYECFISDGELVGAGNLENVFGEQIMNLDARTPCRKLLCRFRMDRGQTSFKILDMKVDCKVV
jgi:hypothetical protein